MGIVNFKYNNGDKLKDKVTGIEGIVMVCAEYSTGCHHYGILQQTLKKDSTMHDWEWLDQSRLEKVSNNIVTFDINDKRPSGSFPAGPE